MSSHMFEEATTFDFIARRLKEIQAQEWEAVRTPEKPEPAPADNTAAEYNYGDFCD